MVAFNSKFKTLFIVACRLLSVIIRYCLPILLKD
jgi:hypothetical protein